jgi:hypothetical protein
MKYIFFLLLTVNIAFYAWSARSEYDSIMRLALNLPEGTERIKLLSEAPPDEINHPPSPVALLPAAVPAAPVKGAKQKASTQPSVPGATLETAAPHSDAPPPPDRAQGCWLLGPYAAELSAQAAQEEIARKVQQTALVNRSADIVDGYWLLYPRADNIEAGRDNRRMLQEKGIHDLWLFDRGELAGYISLGLYQTQAGVEEAQKKYFERNIATEIRPRAASVHGYWIEIPWQGERNQLESALGTFDKSGGSVSLRPC